MAQISGVAVALFGHGPTPAAAASDLVAYAESLDGGWWKGSWGTTLNLNNSTQQQSGSVSASAAYTTAFGGVYSGTNAPLNANNNTAVRFWIHGGSTGEQHIAFILINGSNGNWRNFLPTTPTANVWTPYTVTLSSLDITDPIGGVVWQENGGGAQPTFYLDIVVMNALPAPPLTLSVDVTANRHAISPNIYGMNFAEAALANELHLPVDRYGRSATTRYNYLNDTANRAIDWLFENIPSSTPGGSETDSFVDRDRITGARTIMTLYLIGWTPKDNVYRCGFSVAKDGSQQYIDSPYHSDCDNGMTPGGANVTGNHPLDTSIAITELFDAGWVQHSVARYNTAANGGAMFYDLDNEPMLWNGSHRDVHPNSTSYDELRDKTYQYAPAIKADGPSAKLIGP